MYIIFNVETKLRVINKVSKCTFLVKCLVKHQEPAHSVKLSNVDSAKFRLPDVRVDGFEYFNHLRRYRALSPTSNQTLIAIQYSGFSRESEKYYGPWLLSNDRKLPFSPRLG